MAHALVPRPRLFTLRVLVACCLFLLAIITGIMAAFGPHVILGPRPPERRTTVRAARLVSTGEPIKVVFQPAAIGPGVFFQVLMTIPGGMEGHMRLDTVTLETDHGLWPARTLSQFGKRTWGDALPENAPTQPVALRVTGLAVPPERRLANEVMTFRFIMRGLRPEPFGTAFINRPFEETVEVWAQLGRGRTEPTGLADVDPYNRTTNGVIAGLTLLIVTFVLRKEAIRIRELPQSARPRTSGT